MAAVQAVGGEKADGDEPRHIAFVIAGLSAGGAERVISIIAGHWVAQGRRVTVVTFDRDGDPIFHPLDPRVRLVRLGLPPEAGRPWRVVARVAALRRALASVRPDVTISFLTKINVLTLLASIGTGRRVIVSERNNPRAQNAAPVWNRLLAGLHWRAETIVMQTEASLACLAPRARKRARVIANPIAVPANGDRQTDSHVLTAVGRLTHQKGFDLLIRAFGAVADKHPDWRLRIWGEGEMRPLLEAEVAEGRLGERVDLPGNSNGPAEWIGDAGAFVLSSRYEGFTNVLGEAMAAGLPAVSFDCDYGPAVLIRDEVDGLLVEPGDVAALGRALDRLMGDAALRARLGQAARTSAQRFAPARITAEWDKLLPRRQGRLNKQGSPPASVASA
ncbi:glycosyltransferase family 4 protein [Sphingomonas aerophila]|uniref:Glycosyltransferase involved in cell wall biosynthesis n=1 Tax=Sphingomonas aerophila TaxID=1344948 RepID=A0A7W9BBW1_9SPHN|nr:glycosyltransferase family 4 protein [Sphingomonas aerophila]MBB5714286.1 glycosyltransferase involved in cell wall biosynthesis [Sphingomonas aerophila]